MGRFDTDHFSLHGLWPQPAAAVYCDVSEAVVATDKRRRWRDLEGLGLNDSLQKRLFRIMPGARSFLHRHEWVKHGTCYDDDPNVYYQDSLALMEIVNNSPARQLFARSIGKPLRAGQVRRAFDQAFGEGTGERVRMSCRRDGRRQVITELTFSLAGEITEFPDLGKMARAAPRRRGGCPVGIVDRVGLQ